MANKKFSLHLDIDVDQIKKEVAALEHTTEGIKALATDPIPFLEKCGIKLDDAIIDHIRKGCSDVVAQNGHKIKI
ncbi:MAG: hypothetical protein V6Z89_12050 [Desulfobacter sp.]